MLDGRVEFGLEDLSQVLVSELGEVEENVGLSDTLAKLLTRVVWVAKWIMDALFEGALAVVDMAIEGTGMGG